MNLNIIVKLLILINKYIEIKNIIMTFQEVLVISRVSEKLLVEIIMIMII